MRLRSVLYTAMILLVSATAYAQHNPRAIKIAAGTGFYISHDGYLLTANHVVAHCGGDISAHNDQMVLKANIVDSSAELDLALLKITPKLAIENIAYLRSGRQPVNPGEKVAIAGYPDNRTDLSKEFVDFITNDAKIMSSKGPKGNENWLEFTYSARPGFSGGPVLDAFGNIIGVTSGGTCANPNCTQAFKNALNRLRSATTTEEVRAADDAISASSDTNIAVSTAAIKKFLARNNIAMEERESANGPSENRLEEIAESIVNLRCTQSDQDFNNTVRVFKY